MVDKVEGCNSLRKAVADELDHPAVPDIIQTDSDVKQAVIEAKDNILSRFHKEQTPAPFLICEHFNESEQTGALLLNPNALGFQNVAW